jgi:hypothetical protein
MYMISSIMLTNNNTKKWVEELTYCNAKEGVWGNVFSLTNFVAFLTNFILGNLCFSCVNLTSFFQKFGEKIN